MSNTKKDGEEKSRSSRHPVAPWERKTALGNRDERKETLVRPQLPARGTNARKSVRIIAQGGVRLGEGE